jgi:hypothetical protein
MRSIPNSKVERYRLRGGELASDTSDGNNGAFVFPPQLTPFSCTLFVVATDVGGWDHVSVHAKGRCPSWKEMQWVRELFFQDDEWAVQYSPAKSEHINKHEYTLHWFRPQQEKLPLPPREFV